MVAAASSMFVVLFSGLTAAKIIELLVAVPLTVCTCVDTAVLLVFVSGASLQDILHVNRRKENKENCLNFVIFISYTTVYFVLRALYYNTLELNYFLCSNK